MIKEDGFNFGFEPSKCNDCQGKCCRGEAGYIWVNDYEINKIVQFLNVSREELERGCLKKTHKGYSIKDIVIENERVCFFFNMKKFNCSIYDVRPKQCRTFPFWDGFKSNMKDLEEECPAIVF